MLVPRVRLPAGALTICPACLQAKDEEFARRANASSQRALRESCYFEEKTNVVEPKKQKEGIFKKTTVVFISIALLDEKSTSEQRFSERKPHTLKQRKGRKKTPNPTNKAFQRGRFRPPSLPRKARLHVAAAAKQGTNGCARIENPSKQMPCRDPGSSRGPSDLQSDALPTELSRLCVMLQMLVTPVGHRVAIILIWGPHG